jgi:hypothetical protein
MADGVAIAAIASSSSVALASLGVNVWLDRVRRRQDRAEWMRDRRTEAYIDALAIIEQTRLGTVPEPRNVSLALARLRAFGTPKVTDLFFGWQTAFAAGREPGAGAAETLLGDAIAEELQGRS